jgi:FtsZ-interacting cell division protein ZipA
MQALSALTPPLVVCAVVIIAIVAFLRHEMARSRTDRSARGDEADVRRVLSSPETDKKQNDLTDASQASADDSGPVPRRLR